MLVTHRGCLSCQSVNNTYNVCLVASDSYFSIYGERYLSSSVQGSKRYGRGVWREVVGYLYVYQSAITIAESAQLSRVVHVCWQHECVIRIEGFKRTLKYAILRL